MDVETFKRKPNRELKAGFISKIFFWWLNPIFCQGFKRDLGPDDLFELCPEDEANVVAARLEKAWNAEVEKCREIAKETKKPQQPRLRRAIIKAFGKDYMLMGLIALFEEIIRILQPVLMGFLINYFRCGSTVPTLHAYMYAAAVSGCAATFALVHHIYIYRIQRIGLWVKVACSSLMYKKALKLRCSDPSGSGKVINLLSNDVSRFEQYTIFLHYLWLSPIALVAFIALLYIKVDFYCIPGFGAVILITLIQGFMSSRMPVIKRKFNACTDERGTVMTELIKGIRVVKMYAWEVPFSKIIDKIRLRECWTLLSGVMIQATIIGLFFAAGKLAIFGTVLAMVYYGGAISASNIFVASALFNLARVTVGLFLPLGLMQWKDISVTLERIEQFMSREEREPSMKVKSGNEKKNIDGVAPYVDIQHLSARYEDDAGSKLDLEDITFTAKAGELITIVGPVGAGKTSVFFSILDENLRVVSGSVSSHGTIAYVPQEAWMFSSTVRKNITFIKEFDALQYSKTIDACDLKEDLKKLEQKDLTVIGDKGAQLSGGQKARVNLARAVYYDADIYLFDDPLSAVDPKVGRHLFDRCINGVLKDKVRILATHQLDYLRAANTIVLINGGKMVDAGSYDELVRRRGAEFFKLLEETEMSYRELAKTPKVRLSSTSSSNVPGTPSRANSVESKVTASMSPRKSIGSPKAEFRTPGREDYADEQAVALLEPVESPELRHADSSWSIQMGNAEEGVNAGDAVDPEDRSTGSISTGIYLRYFLSMGNPVIIAIVMLFSMFVQFVFNMCDWWLNLWATKYEMESAEEMLNFTNLTSCTQKFQSVPSWSSSLSHIDYQNWYIGLVFGLLGTSLLRSICFRAMQVRGSYTLHNKMFRSLIQAPISFFDKTPYGRISNRFTKDMNVMDEQLSFVVFDFLQGFFQFIGILVVVGFVNPMIFVVAGPLCVVFLLLRWFYLKTSRSIKRLEATTRSPVYSHMQGTLDGLVSIRTFRAEDRVTEEFQQTLNSNTAAVSLTLTSSRWLAVYVDWLSAIFVSAVSFGSVLAISHLTSGEVALSLFYAISVTAHFAYNAQQSALMETAMVAVERIVEYTKLESEGDFESKEPPPKTWPPRGAISFKDLKLRYSETSPYVLKGITCDIKPSEKIGIVGRTGAGKSSFIGSLFRLMKFEGKILIDDIDTQSIGLHELRSQLSIIPQEPFLFKATIRKNLDPFEEYSDAQVWESLERVELKSFVMDSMPLGLSSMVEQNGSNLSVGQKQLVCLARALLRKSKILVIDEGTANVDQETDALIQKTIQLHFKKCTVLTIAHRLNTIMNTDKIMVLKDGEMMEFDEPLVLLEKRDSVLRSLADEMGAEGASRLVGLARAARNERIPPPKMATP